MNFKFYHSFWGLKKLLFLTILFFLVLLLTSCPSETGTIEPSNDFSAILINLTNNVIVATYEDLHNQSQALLASVNTLNTDRTDVNLLATRNAWRSARQPWEQSEGFLFGPVDTKGLDPSLDSWPVNQIDFENILAGNDNLTQDFVASLEGTLRGFHTIEFLLWGSNSTKNVGDFTDREFSYLIATTQVLETNARTLVDSWRSSGENFANNLINAGNEGSIYVSAKSAIEELANGILTIADEVGNGKINDPLAEQNLSLEESQFSNNSKTDFTDNMISIQNIYTGQGGASLSTIVTDRNSDLDTQIKNEIQAAIDAIQTIPGTFTEAIPSNSLTHASARSAQTAVKTLEATIREELIPLISGL